MLVVKINKCILDVDFLEKLNLENIFESVFSNQKGTKKNEVQCFRIDKSSDFDVLSNLKYLFDRDSEHLTQFQKKLFAKLLNEFCDVFSKIIADYCRKL